MTDEWYTHDAPESEAERKAMTDKPPQTFDYLWRQLQETWHHRMPALVDARRLWDGGHAAGVASRRAEQEKAHRHLVAQLAEKDAEIERLGKKVFTKKHYEVIAAAIKECREVFKENSPLVCGGIDFVAGYLSMVFQKDNPNFDVEKYRIACGYDPR